MAVQLEAIPTAPQWAPRLDLGPTRRAVPEARVLRAPSAPRLASPLWKKQTFARRSQRPRSPFGDPAWRGALTSEQSMGSRWTRAETRGICGRAAALCTPSERSAVFLLFLFFSEWLRADAHGAAGCAPSLAYTVRVLVGAEQTLREPQWVPQSVKRVHGRPPPASLQASAVWPDLAGPLPEVMLFRGAGRTPCTRRGVRQGARGPPPAARATLPGEERGVTGQPQSGCTRQNPVSRGARPHLRGGGALSGRCCPCRRLVASCLVFLGPSERLGAWSRASSAARECRLPRGRQRGAAGNPPLRCSCSCVVGRRGLRGASPRSVCTFRRLRGRGGGGVRRGAPFSPPRRPEDTATPPGVFTRRGAEALRVVSLGCGNPPGALPGWVPAPTEGVRVWAGSPWPGRLAFRSSRFPHSGRGSCDLT